jgi:hypothetical protein
VRDAVITISTSMAMLIAFVLIFNGLVVEGGLLLATAGFINLYLSR